MRVELGGVGEKGEVESRAYAGTFNPSEHLFFYHYASCFSRLRLTTSRMTFS